MKVAILMMVPLLFALTVVAFMPMSEATSPNVPEFANENAHVNPSSETSSNAPEKNPKAGENPNPKRGN